MTPEQQLGLLVTALVLATVALIKWFPGYITRLADERFKTIEHERNLERLESETEIEVKRTENETKRRLELAQAETFERVVLLLKDSGERHSKLDERNADNTEKWIESNNRLANAIEAQTRAATTSQSWQETRANDVIDTVNVINEKLGNLERGSDNTLSKLDILVLGLQDVKAQLDTVLIEAKRNPNWETLQFIKEELATLIMLTKTQVDIASRHESTQPIPEIDDTKELPTPVNEDKRM
jgi:hypothetical protein